MENAKCILPDKYNIYKISTKRFELVDIVKCNTIEYETTFNILAKTADGAKASYMNNIDKLNNYDKTITYSKDIISVELYSPVYVIIDPSLDKSVTHNVYNVYEIKYAYKYTPGTYDNANLNGIVYTLTDDILKCKNILDSYIKMQDDYTNCICKTKGNKSIVQSFNINISSVNLFLSDILDISNTNLVSINPNNKSENYKNYNIYTFNYTLNRTCLGVTDCRPLDKEYTYCMVTNDILNLKNYAETEVNSNPTNTYIYRGVSNINNIKHIDTILHCKYDYFANRIYEMEVMLKNKKYNIFILASNEDSAIINFRKYIQEVKEISLDKCLIKHMKLYWDNVDVRI